MKGEYEEYTYHPREPENEKKRLLIPALSRADVISHHCYAGTQDFNNFHVLVAGAGTGDSALFWAEQLRDKENARLVYFDMSSASMAVAKERAQIRQLDNIEWHQGSILDLPSLDLGQFDFIECSGVLHHLADPDEGLRALRSVLKPDGVIDIMVYATYGRTAVYHMQELMRLVNGGEADRQKEVENTKKIIDALPPQNWFSVGQEHVVYMHDVEKDAGLYDLLLHTQDRAYTITDIYAWLGRCSLEMTGVPGIGTSEHMFYHPETFIQDSALLAQVKRQPPAVQQAIAENMCGRIIKHHFYCSHAGHGSRAVDIQECWGMVPYAGIVEVPPYADIAKAFASQPDRPVIITSDKYEGMPVFNLNGGKLEAAILCLIDGQRTVEDIFNTVRDLPDFKRKKPTKFDFMKVFTPMAIALNRVNHLFLRDKSVAPYTRTSVFENRVKDLYGE
ncbi:MAG: class I SAM-dependent methyltransferase [Alphaproteobacteria bacterium]|nr:class I SAM-dependent methyltransferase [Alphaproteobacteria bacterium]